MRSVALDVIVTYLGRCCKTRQDDTAELPTAGEQLIAGRLYPPCCQQLQFMLSTGSGSWTPLLDDNNPYGFLGKLMSRWRLQRDINDN
jgi:hypothetical protein